MENIKLPFQIGTQYEEWEFQLEPIEHEISNGVDSYTYLDKLLLLGVIVKETKLHFYLDILVVVQLHIDLNTFLSLNKLTSQFDQKRKTRPILKHHLDEKNELWFILQSQKKTLILYGTHCFLSRIY